MNHSVGGTSTHASASVSIPATSGSCGSGASRDGAFLRMLDSKYGVIAACAAPATAAQRIDAKT
jgi:hypothetical protein